MKTKTKLDDIAPAGHELSDAELELVAGGFYLRAWGPIMSTTLNATCDPGMTATKSATWDRNGMPDTTGDCGTRE